MEAKMGIMLTQAKEHLGLKAARSKEGSSARGFRGCGTASDTANILTSDFWHQDCERTHFCCPKPHSLWYFVTKALRNYYYY